MSEGKTYLYETEVEWTGAKDLKLSGAKQPAIAEAPPEFQGSGGKLVARASVCCLTEQLLCPDADCDRTILQGRSRRLSSTAKRKLRSCNGAGIRSQRS